MDLSIPGSDLTSPLSTAVTSVFSDNVQDLLGAGTLQVKPSSIITVNSIADVADNSVGVTTLREAINQANADTGEDLIVFDRSLFSSAQTITLNLGELDITHNLDIIAPRDSLTGADLVTVSGNKTSRVFEIETGATVTVSGLIEADGLVPLDNAQVALNNSQVAIDNGGGIKNSGTLTLDSSIVRNNSIPNPTQNNPVSGGGIYNTGTLEVNNSTLSGNSAALGGGISNQGTLTVRNSTLSSNSASQRFGAAGGGIYNTGTAKVLNSTIIENSISSNGGSGGGGIFNTGNLQVSKSTLNNNSAGAAFSDGGGILNTGTGTLEISNSTLSGNSALEGGGGISNGGSSIIKNSTFSGNSAPFGGGISNVGTMTVTNSTLTGNSASGNNPFSDRGNIGGGIYNDGTLTLVFSTLTLNSAANGSGVYNDPGSVGSIMVPEGTVNVRNTIIAGNINSTGGVNPDVSGTFTSNGYNLIGNGTGSTGFSATGDIVGTSTKPIDPLLGPLASNGGPTQTIALLKNSPAINAGDPTLLPTDPKTDQRGKRRVRGGRADIGAFEFS